MLGWIEKVVPQPPVNSPVPVVVEKAIKAEESPIGAKSGLARQGQSKKNPLERMIECQRQEGPALLSLFTLAGRGVLTWLSEGLGKVMPQPAQNSVTLQETITLQEVGQSFEASIDIPDVTEVQSIHEEADEDGLEMQGPNEEEGNGELQSSSDNNAPEKSGGKKVFTWLIEGFGKMVPQPENMKKNEVSAEEADNERTAEENTAKRGRDLRNSSNKAFLTSSVFGWFAQGLEKVMPHPVSKAKQDGQSVEVEGSGPGQEMCTLPKNVVEFFVENDHEIQEEVMCWEYEAEHPVGAPPGPLRQGGTEQEGKRDASDSHALVVAVSEKAEAVDATGETCLQEEEEERKTATLGPEGTAGRIHIHGGSSEDPNLNRFQQSN
ncbi:hypothetical protein lerEdw1_001065 [Lerista edwardsae]|nr:hypothetical protein lerEdw1_001065 [Lerista edwardsae]